MLDKCSRPKPTSTQHRCISGFSCFPDVLTRLSSRMVKIFSNIPSSPPWENSFRVPDQAVSASYCPVCCTQLSFSQDFSIGIKLESNLQRQAQFTLPYLTASLERSECRSSLCLESLPVTTIDNDSSIIIQVGSV